MGFGGLGRAVPRVFRLCGSDLDESSLGGHFLGDLYRLVVGLLDGVPDLLEHDLDVGRLGGVLSDATVRPVGAAAPGGCLVGLGVVDDAGVDVEALGLGIGDGVEEEVPVDGGRLYRPPALVAGGVDLLGHSLAADAPGEYGKGDDRLVLEDVVEVLDGGVDLHALGEGGDLAAVLEVDAEVGSTGLGDLLGDFGIDGAVSDHFGMCAVSDILINK
mmetsp:Transcript_1799/g.3873  ORF Transcript_1799/g.3873 Transcript_1799/m.3873 type:complete len:216 (+) Transcript_1799:743-1390(+)